MASLSSSQVISIMTGALFFLNPGELLAMPLLGVIQHAAQFFVALFVVASPKPSFR